MRYQEDKFELLEDWKMRFKISTTDLQYKIKRNSTMLINVSRRLDLIPKYKKQFVSFSELSQDLKIIKKNQLVIFLCNDRVVGGVVRDVALKKFQIFWEIRSSQWWIITMTLFVEKNMEALGS